MIKVDTSKSAKEIQKLIDELFPIHRTLVNEGYKSSLEILKKSIPYETLEVPSGTEVFDWVVPKSWNVVKAQIRKLNGDVLVDFETNNLHLSAYSQDFNGIINHEDLMSHLNYREDLPKAIPYNFHYYKPNWSFNIRYDQLSSFNEEEYEVEIITNTYDDTLKIGEVFIQGHTDEEILITSYMCHPSMVNDNLSGVVVTTELFKYLLGANNLKYSYRLIIVPETIGAISFLSEFPQKCANVKAGMTVYCCGSGKVVNYKKTYSGDNYVDKVMNYLSDNLFKEEMNMLPFWPGGSDERQFNGTGVRMPMGALTRTPAAEFTEYHTSLDDQMLIKSETLADTLEKVAAFVNVVESDATFINKYTGEPCFSRHNIAYPTFNDALSKSAAYIVKILANEIDGTNSLLDIAVKWSLNIFDLASVAKEMMKEDLIEKK